MDLIFDLTGYRLYQQVPSLPISIEGTIYTDPPKTLMVLLVNNRILMETGDYKTSTKNIHVLFENT